MTRRTRFAIAATIFAVLALVEMLGGSLVQSVAVVSDGMHNLADALALGLGALALRVALGTTPSERMHFGWHRLEVVSALLNGAVLLAVALGVLASCVMRLATVKTVHVDAALPLVAASLVTNVGVALWLRPQDDDLNQRAAYLHVLADAAWTAGVLVALLAVRVTGRAWIDPVAAALVSLPIAWSALGVVRRSGGILLQRTHVDPADVVAAMRRLEGVLDVPDIRLWHACSYLVVGTAHVVTTAPDLRATADLAHRIRTILEGEFGIKHVTLEFESPEAAIAHPHDLELLHEDDAPSLHGHAHDEDDHDHDDHSHPARGG